MSRTLQRRAEPGVLFVQRWLRGDEGIVTYMRYLSRGLVARGWRVGLALGPGRPGDTHEQAMTWLEDVRGARFTVDFPARATPTGVARSARSLLQAADEFGADVLHVGSLSVLPACHWVRLRRGTPVVATRHASRGRSARGLSRLVKAYGPLLGDRHIAVSSEVRAQIVEGFGVAPSRVRTVYYGIDTEHFRSPTSAERADARGALGLGPDEFAVALVGRLEIGMKRQDLLVEAVAALRARDVPAVALLAGAGEGADELETQAARLGVGPHVRSLGFRPPRGVYWAADVFALPSRGEGLPLTVNEAMSTGLTPIRAVDSGVYDQIEDSVSGFIVPYDDAQALTDRLDVLFREPERRRRMAEAARARALERFTVERMVAQTVAVYEEVAGRGRMAA